MKSRFAFVLAALTLLPGVPLTAQEPAPQPGQRIRVKHFTAYGLRTEAGSLAELSGDTLRFRTGHDTVAVSLLNIERLEVSRGHGPPDSSRVLKGFVRGAWPGAVILGVVALRCGGDGGYDCLPPLAVGVLWVVVGGARGAVRGASAVPELWEDVPLDPLRRRDQTIP